MKDASRVSRRDCCFYVSYSNTLQYDNRQKSPFHSNPTRLQRKCIVILFDVCSNSHHAMSSASSRSCVFPASLSLLAIYNPSLSNDDETLHNQILYYYSGNAEARNGKSNLEGDTEENREELNERLRQIGLAQGMVEFAKY